MKLRIPALAICALLTIPSLVAAQRTFSAGSIILDDGASHTITIVPPTMTTNFTWQLPIPPTGAAQPSGFVPAGTVVGQMLSWSGTQWSTIPAISNVWQRIGTTLSPATTGDNISTSGQLQLGTAVGGMSTFAAGAQGGTNINYVLPTAQGAASSMTMLSNDGSGNLSWSNPIKFVRKTSPTTYSTTSLTPDADLVVAVSANQTYTFEGYISVSDVAGGSPKFAFTSPAGSTLSFGYVDALGLSSTTVTTIISASGTATPNLTIYNDGGTAKTLIFIRGLLITGATAGNLQLQAAEFGGSIALNANSNLQVTRVQ